MTYHSLQESAGGMCVCGGAYSQGWADLGMSPWLQKVKLYL